MNKEAALNQKEAKRMTNYYLKTIRYFLSTTVLAGFGVALTN